MMEVNLPDVLSELTAAFDAYERALLANDFAALERLFWDSPLTLRYGVREAHYSHADIADFRRRRGPIDQCRVLRNTRITTFGRDVGVANTEFIPCGSDRIGRQSQTWIRTDAGWRVASAHVSLLA
jgi:hypothetical protein